MQEISNNPLVSIIIPAYNAALYIQETIQSVLNQTYQNFEIIIVNDGSTDNTKNIIEDFQKKESRIKIINKTNTGVSNSRNIGLNLAKGEYVVFLDADDILLPMAINERLQFIKENNLEATYSAYELINSASEYLNKKTVGSENISLSDVLQWKSNYITIPSAYIYKTEVIKSIGGYDTDLSNNADQDLLVRLLHHQKKIGYINHVDWLYRRHDRNMSANLHIMEEDTITAYKKYSTNGYFQSNSFKKKCYANMYLILAGSWWKDGKNYKKGLFFIAKAFLSHPIFTIKKLINKLV